MTAFTTVPFLVWPSGAASFTLAVTTSPKPARKPVEPPNGRIICSLRAPLLSATSSMLRIITVIRFSLSCQLSSWGSEHPPLSKLESSLTALATHSSLLAISAPLLPLLPAPAPSCAQFLSASSASTSRADAFPRAAPRRQCALRSSRHGRKTSSLSKSLGCREGAPADESPAPQSSCACGSKSLRRLIPCAFRQLLFPPSLLLPCRGALVGNRLDPGNVLAQPAQLLQALGLSHVELKLQLEQLIAHFLFLVTKLFVSQISNFFCFHKSSVETLLATSQTQQAASLQSFSVPFAFHKP